MPQLACIIPVVGSTEGLETTLLSVLERRPDNCEILIVTNIAYDDPYHLQGEIQILPAPPKAGRAECINLGIQTTQSPIVHVLACGLQACDGWVDRALVHFEDPLVAAVTPLVYDAEDRQQLLAAGIGYRLDGRRIICQHAASESSGAVGPLLQAAFYRKMALESLGGLPTAVGDDLADVDVALTLRRAGWQTRVEPKSQVLASHLETTLSHNAMELGLWSERLFWRHVTDASWISRLLLHPCAALLNVAMTKPWWKAPAQTLGRLLAVCQLGHYRQYRQLLRACAESRITATAFPAQPKQSRDQVIMQAVGTMQRIDAAHAKITKPEADRQHARRSQKR